MAKDPAFLFYSNDFLTGTFTMTDKQVGQYIRLMCLQHQQGHLAEETMLTVCKKPDTKIWSKFQRDDQGLYFNSRLDIEIEKRSAHSKAQTSNVNKRWEKERNKNLNSNDDRIPSGNTTVLPLENEIEIEKNNTSFQEGNGRTEDAREALSKVMTLYLDRISATPSSEVVDTLKSYTEDMTADVVCRAINIAIDENARKWSYIRAILQAWSREKVKSLDDVQRIETARLTAKNGKKQFTPAADHKSITPTKEDNAAMQNFLKKLREDDS